MTEKKAISIILGVLESRLHVSHELLNEDNMDKSLLLKPFGLSSLSMAYLFLEIEKESGFLLDSSLLVDMGFSTINKIADVICKSVKKD